MGILASNYPSTYGVQTGTLIVYVQSIKFRAKRLGRHFCSHQIHMPTEVKQWTRQRVLLPPNLTLGFDLDNNTAYCYRQSRVAECLLLPEDGRLANEGVSGQDKERKKGYGVAWLRGGERGSVVVGMVGVYGLKVDRSSI